MQQTQADYREYINEIPLNTVRLWGDVLMKELRWSHVGWSGAAREPYRHWAAYPEFDGVLVNIWNTIDFSFKEDGYNLKVERVIANLFAHGDSSWVHKDCEEHNKWTAILYLNDFWDINWGGETILTDGKEIIKSFAPTPGKFILFKSNVLHGPRPVSREAPYPRFGLAFQCKTDDSNIQKFSGLEVSPVSSAKL